MELATTMSYIILGEYIGCAILQFYTIAIFGTILYGILKKTQTIRLSFSFLIYIFLATAFASTAFILLSYNILFWKPAAPRYNVKIFWSIGSPCFVAMGTISTSVLFLGIERCIILLYPHQFTQQRRKLFHIIEIIVLAALATSFVTLNIAREMPDTETTNCYTFGCMMVKHSMSSYIYVRYVVALLNSLVGAILFMTFYNRSKVNKDLRKLKFSKNNKLVLWAITAALVFDFMPHFAAFCSNTFFGINPNHYIGPYGIIATTLDVSSCAEVSRRVFSCYKYKRTGSVMASSV